MIPNDMAFAKVVSTKDGPALLIGGTVINIASASPEYDATELAKALRGRADESTGAGNVSSLQAGLQAG